jgi:hypothetical protein
MDCGDFGDTEGTPIGDLSISANRLELPLTLIERIAHAH